MKGRLWITIIAAVAGAAVLSAAGAYDSVLGSVLERLSSPDWDRLPQRDIVKNSIPIRMLERAGGDCRVSAEHFGQIIDHSYFARSSQQAQDLRYDRVQGTLTVPCGHLHGEESALHVWYVVPEAPRHAERYTYFITD